MVENVSYQHGKAEEPNRLSAGYREVFVIYSNCSRRMGVPTVLNVHAGCFEAILTDGPIRGVFPIKDGQVHL